MDGQNILDSAFRAANKRGSVVKSSKTKSYKDMFVLADAERVKTVYGSINSALQKLVDKSNANISEFEKNLIATNIDLHKVDQERKKIIAMKKILQKLSNEYEVKVKYSDNGTQSNIKRKEYYGRISSLLKKANFPNITLFAREFSRLPKLKKYETVIVCGCPNVGKSMLLNSISGANIEIASYPFTTKQLYIGYIKNRYDTVQLIDTPGILDRPFSEMNNIEKKAFIALKYLSNKFIFVIDPSETCGYTLENQISLMNNIKKMFDPKMLVVATKKDLGGKEVESDIYVNLMDKEDTVKLYKKIIEFFFKTKP